MLFCCIYKPVIDSTISSNRSCFVKSLLEKVCSLVMLDGLQRSKAYVKLLLGSGSIYLFYSLFFLFYKCNFLYIFFKIFYFFSFIFQFPGVLFKNYRPINLQTPSLYQTIYSIFRLHIPLKPFFHFFCLFFDKPKLTLLSFFTRNIIFLFVFA